MVENTTSVNVQGDEPIIDPESIDQVVNCLKRAITKGIMVSTGYIPEATIDQLEDPSVGHLLPSLVETVKYLCLRQILQLKLNYLPDQNR